MPQSKPYQPLLFRLLHNITSFIVIGAAITGFLVYDSWDGRFGRLGITLKNRELIDIHGTFGFFFLPILILFAIYSIRAGSQRLVQPDSLKNLTKVGKPIWWYSLQRLANTMMLVAGIFALVSGKFQDENWLPKGEMSHVWYYVHLIAWCVVVAAIAIHVLMSVKVGGAPLILSMFDLKIRPEDSPSHWPEKVKAWLRRPHL
ncbi:cytochrome b/b6 domain-containing protein [Planktothrix sp. FACHB-1355]|uniref:Cytochrome b/b6 domain-containing protein n=1 Tax=Aerosakkonema funiforme FACHB-1375 TaxID=2949571 RepID=A0A926VIV9_9CYAN|nr:MULTISPECIES: cytochrome b/b6 domain-containing protein [Oscillatoriales]MBD2184675.1 cytochrome b/b6 domain-containing protein [Aerosakkonema funiforme FACHB-1375]MBD3561791.1 cytochrome b/b6 domain-containing protein [Planktothrix sp. FACHB-1355]